MPTNKMTSIAARTAKLCAEDPERYDRPMDFSGEALGDRGFADGLEPAGASDQLAERLREGDLGAIHSPEFNPASPAPAKDDSS
jgi:hypothetical protein